MTADAAPGESSAVLPTDVLDGLRPADGWPDAEEWRTFGSIAAAELDDFDLGFLLAGGPQERRELDKRARQHRAGSNGHRIAADRPAAGPPTRGTPGETCAYVREMLAGWATDTHPSRHNGHLSQRVRLECARELGCITEADYAAALAAINERLRDLRAADGTGDVGEIERADAHAFKKVAAKSDSEMWAELGDHDHGHADDTVVVCERPREVVGDAETGETATPANGVIDGAAFVLDQPRDIPPVWGVGNQIVWAEGESLMIAAPPGTGKTTLAGQLGRAQIGVGDGLVLGLPVAPAKGPVLYLAMDRPRQIARSLARQFTEADRAALRDGLLVRPGPPVRDMAEDTDLLVNTARYYGAAVVYIDSLKDAAVGLADDRVGAGYNRARQKLLAAGIELCELHHAVKRNANGGAPSSVADVYGSGWLVSGSGSVVFLTGDPGDPLVGFRHLRQPAEDVGPFTLSHDQAAGVLSIAHTVDLLALAAVADQNGLTAKGAACAVFETDKPTASQVEKIRRRLDKLADAGELVRREGRKGRAARSETAYFPALDGEPDGGRWP